MTDQELAKAATLLAKQLESTGLHDAAKLVRELLSRWQSDRNTIRKTTGQNQPKKGHKK